MRVRLYALYASETLIQVKRREKITNKTQIPRRRSEALVAGLFVGFPLSDADITDSSKRLCKFMHRLVCVCVSDSRRDNPVCFLDQSQLNWAERKHMVSLSYFLQSAPFSSPWLPSSLFLLFPGFVSVETNLSFQRDVGAMRRLSLQKNKRIVMTGSQGTCSVGGLCP